MDLSQEELDQLTKIAAFEDSMEGYQKDIGWIWQDVGLYTATINKFLVKGLVKLNFKSRSSTNYLLTDRGRAVAQGGKAMLEDMEVPNDKAQQDEQDIDVEGMFLDIVGYDDTKELIRESLQLGKPIHVLLWGPPSLAKSMFLWDVERAYGHLAIPLIGSATSHAGMWDLITEKRPKIVLIDELEKMNLTDLAGLLSLMETGRIIRTKVGRKLDEELTCWVLGTANRINKLPVELLSRFAKFQLVEYNSSEYTHVVESVLVHREDIDSETAHEIAMRLVGATHDVRDSVRVARLSKRVGVKRAVELLIS